MENESKRVVHTDDKQAQRNRAKKALVAMDLKENRGRVDERSERERLRLSQAAGHCLPPRPPAESAGVWATFHVTRLIIYGSE